MTRRLLCGVVMALAMWEPARGAEPDADTIRKTVQEILSQPGYDIVQEKRLELDFSFITDFLRRVWNAIQDYFDALATTSPLLAQAVVVLLFLLVAALVGHIGYSVYRGVRASAPEIAIVTEERDETVPQLIDEAERLAASGNFADASRLLYKGALVMLETKRGGRLRQGLTNREYLATFRTPWVREHLRVFVDLINWKWYRDNTFDESDFQRCKQAFATLQSNLATLGQQ